MRIYLLLILLTVIWVLMTLNLVLNGGMNVDGKKLESYILLLDDYSWDTNKPAWNVPKSVATPISRITNGLSWKSMEHGLLSQPDEPCLPKDNTDLIKQEINTNIPDGSVVLLSLGFGDCIHDKLLEATQKKDIILVSSTLNVIPYLKGNTLILTYDGQLLTRYMTIKADGKARWDKEFKRNHITILGFEDIDKDYQDSLNKSCDQSEEDHNSFLKKAIDKVQDYIGMQEYRIDNILIECTTIMQIVPSLKKALPDVNVIGITEAMEIIINAENDKKMGFKSVL